MSGTITARRQERCGTAAAWEAANPVLREAEWGFETDTGKAKLGDGATAWNNLKYSTHGRYANAVRGLPSAAEFEALAAKRRDEYAGSGFVEWGKHYDNATGIANEGLWFYTGSSYSNLFKCGVTSGGMGVSKTQQPLVVANGYKMSVDGVNTPAAHENKILLPEAPATADLLDRQDLVFLEVWHEDISEKGIVYPYGNVQYGATSYTCPDGTVLTCAAGTFDGNGTYSLFGNWQSSGDLIGKGIVWADLTDAQKQSFAADPQNNLYLDGDKGIQVRYRIRVVEGLGSDWSNVCDTLNPLAYSSDTSKIVKPKGGLVSISADIAASTGGYFMGAENSGNDLQDVRIGAWVKEGTGSFAYEEKCFAIPICLVHRRNQGAFHPVFNPNGTARWNLNTSGTGASVWYIATVIDPVSVDDAFVFLGSDTDTTTAGVTQYTGDVTTNASGRPDGLFYDEINEVDILDLRNSAHKVKDYKRLLECEFNKTVAGEMRGWENTKKVEVQNKGDVGGLRFRYSFNFDLLTTNFHLSPWSDDVYRGVGEPIYITDALFSDVAVFIPISNGIVGSTLKTVFWLSDGSVFPQGSSSLDAILKTRLTLTTLADDGSNYRSYNELRVINPIDLPFSGKAVLHCDIIGDPANYPQEWKDNGVMGTPLLVDEEGSSLIPDGTEKNYKLSRKVKSGGLLIFSDDQGVSWQLGFSDFTTGGGWNGESNTYIAPISSGQIRMYFYLTEASSMELADNAEVLVLGNVWGGSHYNFNRGVRVVSDLIGKVPVADSADAWKTVSLNSMQYNSDTGTLATNASQRPAHNSLSLCGVDTPAAKALYYLTSENGKAFLQLLYKEMVYDTDWGDDGKFDVIDGESTTTDDNGNTVIIGQKRIELPYFIDEEA